jgi:hypothetical protein
MPSAHPAAPPLRLAQWLNTDTPLALDALRGRVVAHAFQMLCPGCVALACRRRHTRCSRRDLVVIGLHTV